MLILTKSDIKKIFSMQQAIAASKKALQLYSAGKTNVPLRTVLEIPKEQAQTLFMPAYIDDLHCTGIKIASVYPNNVKINKPSILASMLLLDAHTGEVIALLDGTYLTQLRTGALQGAATDLLAKADAKIAVLFGTGGQAGTQLEAMLNVRPLQEVRIFDINFERAQAFAATMQQELPQFKARFVAVENGNDAIKDADIITTVTTSKTPVFDGALVKNGAHINGIGAYQPHMQELPETVIQRANKIIFDTTEGVLAEAGDILIPLKSGAVKESHFTGELGELILNKIKGRENDQEITVFKAVGSAVLDVVTADQVYKSAREAGVGNTVDL